MSRKIRIKMLDHHCAAFLLLACSLTLSTTASAAPEEKPSFASAQRFVSCANTLFKVGEISTKGPNGYGIEVQGESIWLAVTKRQTLSLILNDNDESVADLKIDSASNDEFNDQARWRANWLREVADRSEVKMTSQELPVGATLLTVNKKALKGKFAGISVLTIPQHKLFIEWDWTKLSRYATPDDVVAMQSAVWNRIAPCVLAP